MPELDAFIASLPKAELHIHIEGSLEPELLFSLARRNRVPLSYPDVDALRAHTASSSCRTSSTLLPGRGSAAHRGRLRDLAMAYFTRAHADAVRHAEVFFDPQTHTVRGVPLREVVEGLTAGRREAEQRFGMTSKLILCFLRHLDEAAAIETLAAAEPYLDRIDGVGLDSSERGHPPAKFARVFERAGALGLMRVAHAGEEGPPEYVREALDLLGVRRIDHGNRALEDAALVVRLARTAVPLTVCPLSNLRLCVVRELAAHPIARMLALGLRATINSDDPAYFGGYVNANYRAVAPLLGRDGLAAAARNSFLGSFLDDAQVTAHLRELDAYLAT